jgi:hypothetical protein
VSVEFRPIKPQERAECLALWHNVFANDYNFERYFYGDVEWLPYYTQVAVVDGKLVSAVQTVKRTVACGDFRLTMGGIANVATLPEYRGNHYNTELLKRAIEVMEADAMDFSMLGTGINVYYARLGFCTRTRPILEGTIKPDLAPAASPFTVRAAEASDLPAIRAVYDAFNARSPVAVQRYEAYWRDWVEVTPEKPLPNCLVACDAAGTVCGYLSMSETTTKPGDGEEISLLRGVEFGLERGKLTEAEEQDAAHALFAAMIRRFPNAKRLSWDGCGEPIVIETIRGLLADEQPRQASGTMLRLLHRTNLFQSFTLAWNERWIAAGRPTGTLAFQTPYGSTRIDATGNFLRILPDDNAPDALPQEVFFGLLFGLERPEALTDDAAKLALLHALFPPCFFTYWNRDGF